MKLFAILETRSKRIINCWCKFRNIISGWRAPNIRRLLSANSLSWRRWRRLNVTFPNVLTQISRRCLALFINFIYFTHSMFNGSPVYLYANLYVRQK